MLYVLVMLSLGIPACREDGDDAEEKPPLAERVRTSLEQAAEDPVPPPSSGSDTAQNGTATPEPHESDERVTTRPAVPGFQPLTDAKPGEWTEYRTHEGRQLRYEVVDPGAARVRIEVRISEAGQFVGEPAIREDVPTYDPVTTPDQNHQPAMTCTQERVDLAGRSWESSRYESRWIDEEVEYVRKTWVSKEAPVYGLLRMELLGDGQVEASLELTGFGNAGR